MGANQSRRKENIEKNTLKQTLKKGTFKKIPVFSLTRALFFFTESSLMIVIMIIIRRPGAYLREYGKPNEHNHGKTREDRKKWTR